MKKDTCIVIGTYPTTYLDSALLGLTIESWKQQILENNWSFMEFH